VSNRSPIRRDQPQRSRVKQVRPILPKTRISRLMFALFFLLAAGLPALAATNSADLPHVHVQLLSPWPLDRSDADKIGLYFKLEPGWHVYWKNPGDAGLPPHVRWTLPDGITAGPLQFPPPKRLPLGPLMDFGYDGEVLFPVDLKVAKTVPLGPVVLHAKVDWLVCREQCVPGKAEIELHVDVAGPPAMGLATPTKDELLWVRQPKPVPEADPRSLRAKFQPTPTGLRLSVETGERETQATFFPSDTDILSNPAPQKLTPTAKGFILDLKKDANLTANPAQLKGVLELSNGRAYEIVAPSGKPQPPTAELVGQSSSGAKAPMESAASNSGAKAPAYPSDSTSAQGRTGAEVPGLAKIVGLAFLGGLILNLMPCVFPVLFLKGLALVNSGNEEKHKLRAHGLVYTAGILASFWVLVAVLLGLRSAGAHLGWGFQFQSPVFLSLMAGLLFFLGLSLAGQFEIGLTLTSAGGSLAAKQGYTGSFFTGVLAVIVATPCTAPFMGVAIGYALAQPAAVTFAVFTALALGLAAPYAALTLQPAWTRVLPRPGAWMEVLRQAVSVPIFATVIWLAWVLAQAYGASVLAALLASFLLLAIAGWFLGRWPAKGWSTVVAAACVLGVIALSVFAAKELVVAPESSASSQSHSGWEPWSAEAVARYQAQGRPVFVDFTASWCLGCQVNERVALSRPEVRKAFADANVVLLRADWTQHDDTITQALTSLGRSGVPAYALYVPCQSAPQMLPEVLTPGIVTDAVGKLPKIVR
jgi:thiol:disulfide interchange protein/DsbC/DsbD-like thiol-disulfide interchange protein